MGIELIVTDGEEEPEPTSTRRTLIVSLAAGVIVVVGIVVALLAPAEEPPPPTASETAVFIGDVAASTAALWWEAVRHQDLALWTELSHPDSAMSHFPLVLDESASIEIDPVPFGSLDQPQLCYLIASGGTHETGSMVFRFSGTRWLVWEIRPGVESCYVPPPVGG